MLALIRYPVGVIVEGIILSWTGNRMRLAIGGLDDIVELRRSGEIWLAESGQTVEFEFLGGWTTEGGAKTVSSPVPAVRFAGAE